MYLFKLGWITYIDLKKKFPNDEQHYDIECFFNIPGTKALFMAHTYLVKPGWIIYADLKKVIPNNEQHYDIECCLNIPGTKALFMVRARS